MVSLVSVLLRRFGDTEVDHFWNWHTVLHGNQDIRRFEVAMDDALLMRVLHGLADLDKQLQPIRRRELMLIAVSRDRLTANQFHNKVGPSTFGGAAVVHFGNAGMIHQR